MTRSRWSMFPVLGALALVSVAHGQDAKDERPSGDAANEVEGTEVKEGTVRTAPKASSPGTDEVPGQVHTVSRGDTLWDLTQRYMGSPWYWPKVWSYNPQIANPHWIYPGNQVRFFTGNGEEGPTRVDTGEDGELEAAEAVPDDEGGVTTVGRIGFAGKTSELVRRDGFVTPTEVDRAGRIEASFAESEMLSFPDRIYLSFKDAGRAKVGEHYTVFRPGGAVYHPRTGRKVGYLTRVLGTARVEKLGGKYVSATIAQSWDEIRRGDLIGPSGEQLMVSVRVKPNDRDGSGVVLTALETYVTITGESNFLLIDLGSAQGVQVGNTFTIVRNADPLRQGTDPSRDQDATLPTEDIATCLATDVKEQASTCILTRSLREVVAGDRIELRSAAAKTAVLTR